MFRLRPGKPEADDASAYSRVVPLWRIPPGPLKTASAMSSTGPRSRLRRSWSGRSRTAPKRSGRQPPRRRLWRRHRDRRRRRRRRPGLGRPRPSRNSGTEVVGCRPGCRSLEGHAGSRASPKADPARRRPRLQARKGGGAPRGSTPTRPRRSSSRRRPTPATSSSSAAAAAPAAAASSAKPAAEARGPVEGGRRPVPPAMAVARDFAEAFVVYETGGLDAKVRSVRRDGHPGAGPGAAAAAAAAARQRQGAEGEGGERRRRAPQAASTRSASPAAGRRDQRAAARNGTVKGGVASHQRARMSEPRSRKTCAVAATAIARRHSRRRSPSRRAEPRRRGTGRCARARPAARRGPLAAVRQRRDPGGAGALPRPRPRRSGGVPSRRGDGDARQKAEPREASRRRDPGAQPGPGLCDPLVADLQLRRHRGAPGPDPDLPARRGGLRPRPAGPGGLAGINEVETAFGTNITSPPPAPMGWMQFMPSTWRYGVDANGDGVADPNNPEDAIFAAARYLRRRDARRHLRRDLRLQPRRLVRRRGPRQRRLLRRRSRRRPPSRRRPGAADPSAEVRPGARLAQADPGRIPEAFEDAAARYELGRRGVWALAAIARLESNFGRGMDKKELERRARWASKRASGSSYAVDGDEDGHIATRTRPTRRRRWRA